MNGFIKLDSPVKQYTDEYFNHLVNKYETPQQVEMNKKINELRAGLVFKYCFGKNVLDYGCGTGNFVEHCAGKNFKCYGYEVIPKTIERLKKDNLYRDNFNNIQGVCFWDVFEHIPEHDTILNSIENNALVFMSLPIFADLNTIKSSRHYLPGEHLWYFTADGLIDYMQKFCYNCIGVNDYETLAGREDIMTFVFKKNHS
jgi:2-polyprenyl-3-methyl-5-hydroxy-6-metoxy-1,4-benzoquinol methylase